MLHYYYYYIFPIGKPAKSFVILAGSEVTLVELGCKEFNWVNRSGVHDVLGSELGTGEPYMNKTWLLHSKIKSGTQGFPGGTVFKNPPANAGDMGSTPGPGTSHMLWGNQAPVSQLLSLSPRDHAVQREKPP